MVEMSKEQDLVDICFQMVAATTDDPIFCKKSVPEKMLWVAGTLRKCEIYTVPMGASWGVIVSKEFWKENQSKEG